MTLSISEIRERVARQYPDIEQLGDSIIQFRKKAGDVPYAVCYLDVAQELPSTPDELTKYLDRVVGNRYFEGRQSLQWSTYLYFVLRRDLFKNDAILKAKDLIERDRLYARKSVIAEDELESVLAPLMVAPREALPGKSVFSIWRELLVGAGIEKAVLSDANMPSRLALIESSSAEPPREPKTRRPPAQVNVTPFIRRLELIDFRPFPIERTFKFGRVNLVFGANGTGKTSLFEAIELFYCGRNRRNPDTWPPYDLAVTFDDGRRVPAKSDREQHEFRDRNLAWYGQTDIKTNTLYSSFARFNFLDSDAPVSLADSAATIEDDLSKLLIGPDASKSWRNIERVNEALSSRLRALSTVRTQADEELSSLAKILAAAQGIKHESDSIRDRMGKMLHRLGWNVRRDDPEVFATSTIESLAEIVSVATQASTIGWIEPPASIDGLVKYCQAARTLSEQTANDLTALEKAQQSTKQLEERIRRVREALPLAERARQIIEAGVPARAAQRKELTQNATAYAGRVAGLEESRLDGLSVSELSTPVTDWATDAASKYASARGLLDTAKAEYAKYSRLRDQSLNLSEQLREVASKILVTSPEPDECPLCHTRFGPGELAKHIAAGVDEHLEAAGRRHLTSLREREDALRDASVLATASSWLRKFCQEANIPSDIPARSAFVEIEKLKIALADTQTRLNAINAELDALGLQGLSEDQLEKSRHVLRDLGFPLDQPTHDAVTRLVATVDQELADTSQKLDAQKKLSVDLRNHLEASLKSEGSGIEDLRGALSRLKERLAMAQSLQRKLGDFSRSYPWPGGKPLAELVVEADAIRKVAAQLRTALSGEKQAQSAYAESVQRKAQLDQQLAELRPRIERLTKAQSTLDTLQRDHSLSGAMAAALRENRNDIEMIFSRIHSPAEFRGLGSGWTTVVRKADGAEAKMSEISSGQRAAFALSIFLAQNAQLRMAPPIILMDDPIAHVDDLNSLSFFDYLRDVALAATRQIFFATASEKLAALFERKFDFLGPNQFRRIDLIREPRSIPVV
jgi:hypothetical protein